MTQPVLAGIDGSAESRTAVLWAADEAARHGLPLRLVHAATWLDDVQVDTGGPAGVRALAEDLLVRAAEEVRRARPGVEVQTALLGGDEPAEALAAAEGTMLVVGSRGLGGFAGLLVGSVGLAVAARGLVPVVLVRPREREEAGGPQGPAVVVGLDARAPAGEVLEFAFREAAARGAVLRVVYGWDLPPVMSYAGWVPEEVQATQLGAIESELLDEALYGWREKFPEVAVDAQARIGGAAAALVGASAGADLLVVGRGPGRLGVRLGRVAHAVIHHAGAPVAVVPHGRLA